MEFMKAAVATGLELMAAKAGMTSEEMRLECSKNPEMMDVLNKYVAQGIEAYLSK